MTANKEKDLHLYATVKYYAMDYRNDGYSFEAWVMENFTFELFEQNLKAGITGDEMRSTEIRIWPDARDKAVKMLRFTDDDGLYDIYKSGERGGFHKWLADHPGIM